MTLLSQNDATTIAQKMLADFLQQPAHAISCSMLKGGSEEDSVVQCVHQDKHYVVKLFNPNKSGDHEIMWTRLASDLGIGPLLYYADPAGHYMITAFAQGSSLTPAIAHTRQVLKEIAVHLATLHADSAPFSNLSDMFVRIESKYKKIHSTGELKDMLEQGLQLVEIIKDQLQTSTVQSVPCHNDLNPGNIFAHNGKVTLIDWGDAALGNPYYDIAAFLVLNIIDKESERFFFEQYDATLLEKDFWHNEMQRYKRLVYYEFALNLLLGVQILDTALLHLKHGMSVNHISYYLTLLATRKAEINGQFLYGMAIASLRMQKAFLISM